MFKITYSTEKIIKNKFSLEYSKMWPNIFLIINISLTILEMYLNIVMKIYIV